MKKYLYIGAGAFLPGVPTADLTEDEWLSLPNEMRELAVALDLYQVVTAEYQTGTRQQAAGQEPGTEGEADGRSEGRKVDDVADDGSAGVSDDRGGDRHVPRAGRKAARPG